MHDTLLAGCDAIHMEAGTNSALTVAGRFLVLTTATRCVMQILAPCAKSINFNTQIWNLYLDELMPGITEDGDDNNYGSAAMQDVLCLQALSKRIHYGKFVAEAKYRADPEQYQILIKEHNKDAIMQLLTNESVEQTVSLLQHA